MLFDKIKNAPQYYALGERLATSLKYLMQNDFSAKTPGRYEIDGDRIYALVQEYDTRPGSAGKWEAHRKYIDIQYIVEGTELMGYENLESMEISDSDYNPEKDAIYPKGEGSFVKMTAGMFAILWPQDAHMPGQAISEPVKVRKVVIKVLY